MILSQNWALFIEGTEIRWLYNIDLEQASSIASLTKEIQALGEELFSEGIASLTLESSDGSSRSTVLVINFYGRFFFLIHQPVSTCKILYHSAGLPVEIDELLRSVLISQAVVTYGYLWKEYTQNRELIDRIFDDALCSLSCKDNPGVEIANGNCKLSPLKLPELIFLHVYFRRRIEESSLIMEEPWAIIVEKDSGKATDHYNNEAFMEIGGYLGIIWYFAGQLFKKNLKRIHFGGPEKLHQVEAFTGKKRVIWVNNPEKLLKSEEFIDKLRSSDEIFMDIREALEKFLAEKIAHSIKNQLQTKSFERLIEYYNDYYKPDTTNRIIDDIKR